MDILKRAQEADDILNNVHTKKQYLDVCTKYSDVLFNGKISGYKYVLFVSPSDDRSQFVSDNISKGQYSIFNNMIDELVKNTIPVVIAHISAVPEYREMYNIKNDVPTFILFKDGKEIKRFDSKYTKISELISSFNEFL